MGRIIFWLALIGVGYAAWRAWVSHNRSLEQNPEKSAEVPNKRDSSQETTAARNEGEKMLACAHCKVYAPISDMIVQNGQAFCSQEHAQLSQH